MDKFKIIGSLILVNIFFGTGIPLLKSVLHYLPVSEWLYFRALAATLILFFLVCRSFRQMLKGVYNKIGWLILASFLGIMINQICFAEGIKKTVTAHAGIINATTPLITLLAGRLFLKERMNALKMLGVLLGFAGVGYLLGLDRLRDINPYLKGDLLITINAFSYSLFMVVSRKFVHAVQPITAFFWMSLFSVASLGWYADWEIPANSVLTSPSLIQWFIVYLIVVPTIVTYSLNLWSLKRVEASHAALYVYLQPLVATLLAFFMFGDIPSPRFYISSGLIFLGVLLGSWKIK